MPFVDSFPVNPKGQMLVPPDTQLRSKLFPPHLAEANIGEFIRHPAKANLNLVKALVEYVTLQGQIILDPMAGSGSIFIAATIERSVFAIELRPTYCNQLRVYAQSISPNISILEGDCVNHLPLPCHAVIFSPPYANIIKPGSGILSREKEHKAELDLYYEKEQKIVTSSANLGALNEFMYNQRMEVIYKLLHKSLPVGGPLVILLKDFIRQGQRHSLSLQAIRMCETNGFRLEEWCQWYAKGGQFVTMKRAKGEATIDEEDVIIMRRK